MMETFQGPKGGFWPAGSWIDRLDTSLSMAIFTLTVPAPVEFLLTTLGMWFGVPLISLFLGSLMLGAAVKPALLQSRALPPFFMVLAWWAWLVAESKRDSSSSSNKKKKKTTTTKTKKKEKKKNKKTNNSHFIRVVYMDLTGFSL